MYYNNNNYNNYNGRYNQYGMGQNTSPYQQQQQPTYYQQPINVNDLPIDEIRYMTAAEADAYIVMPNHKALLIDKASGVAKIKAADMSGQSTSKLFSFKEINENELSAQQKPENLYLTREEGAEYVKKADFDAFRSKDFVTRADLNEVLRKLDALQTKPTKKVGEN